MMLTTEEMQQLITISERHGDEGAALATQRIREAVESDAEALQRYYELMAQEDLNNTSLRPGLIPKDLPGYRDLIHIYQQQSNCCLLVVLDADPVNGRENIVGQIKLTGGDMPISRHVVEISINLHPDYRGQGLGTALMKCGIAWAWQQGEVYRLQLEVLPRNVGAIRMYENLGFQIESERIGAYYLYDEADPAYSDAYVMALLLPRRGPRAR